MITYASSRCLRRAYQYVSSTASPTPSITADVPWARRIENFSTATGNGKDLLSAISHLDLARRERTGFAEVVFGEGKSPQQIQRILDRLAISAGPEAVAAEGGAPSTGVHLHDTAAARGPRTVFATRVNRTIFRSILQNRVAIDRPGLFDAGGDDASVRNSSDTAPEDAPTSWGVRYHYFPLARIAAAEAVSPQEWDPLENSNHLNKWFPFLGDDEGSNMLEEDSEGRLGLTLDSIAAHELGGSPTQAHDDRTTTVDTDEDQWPLRLGVLAAGTCDIPVAEEAAVTAELQGFTVSRVYDVGVAGLHRLLSERSLSLIENSVRLV